MSATKFCSQCCKHHSIEEMRQVETKAGRKWRCIKSLEAAKKSATEQDAFGKQVTAMNSEAASAAMKLTKVSKDNAV